jgi:hypothetical protein
MQVNWSGLRIDYEAGSVGPADVDEEAGWIAPMVVGCRAI